MNISGSSTIYIGRAIRNFMRTSLPENKQVFFLYTCAKDDKDFSICSCKYLVLSIGYQKNIFKAGIAGNLPDVPAVETFGIFHIKAH